MAKLTKLVHDLETGEVVEVELTAAEIAEAELQNQDSTARLESEAAKAAEKDAILAKLGITEDEAKLLLS